MRKINFEKLQNLLLDQVLSNVTIPALFRAVYGLIHLPLNYFDTSFKLIANALERPFYFPPWEAMAEHGCASDKDIAEGRYLDSQEKMYSKRSTSIFDTGTTEGYPQACGPVFVDKTLVGYMGTMVEDVSQEDAIRVNELIIDAIIILTRREKECSVFQMRFDAEDILLRTGVSPYMQEVFEQEHAGPYCYAVIHSKNAAVTTLHYLYRYLTQENPSAVICVNGEHYLHLLYCGLQTYDIYRTMCQIAQRHKLSIGISDYFSTPTAIPVHRTQALLALSMGNFRSQLIHYFPDYLLDVVCLSIKERRTGLNYLQQELKLLHEKDVVEHSAYIETLRTYFDCFQKSANTAKALGVHTNTILSRLARIEELTGLELKNPDVANQLDFQLNFIKTIGNYFDGGDEIW